MGGVRDIVTSPADKSNDLSDDEPTSKRQKVSWLADCVVYTYNVYNGLIESSIVVLEGKMNYSKSFLLKWIQAGKQLLAFDFCYQRVVQCRILCQLSTTVQ